MSETKPDPGDPTEWQLLSAAAMRQTNDVLGPLAEYYTERARWDEMSAVKSRMLASIPPGPGPAPGGPFPRIGVPNDHPGPPTILARWLNATDLPELYAATQVTQEELEVELRGLPPTRDTRVRLAALLCSELRFREAATLYEQALAERDDAALRRRLADVKKILGR